MRSNQFFVIFCVLFLTISITGCQSQQPDDQNTINNTSDNSDLNSGLITNNSEENINDDLPAAAPSLFENPEAGYKIAYLDDLEINSDDPNHVIFSRDNLNLTIDTLSNPSQYDLITYISLNESFPWHYLISDFTGRIEIGKKLVFTGKGADSVSPVYYYAHNDRVYKITATRDDSRVLEYIASTIRFDS